MDSIAGPISTSAGTAVGGLAGAALSHGAAQRVNLAAEYAYWKGMDTTRAGCVNGYDHHDDASAYRLGYEGCGRHAGRRWDDVASELRANWERTKATSRLTWEQARLAARDAWDRVERALPGDADGDGR